MSKNHPVHFWPVLPSRSGPDANRIRHVYWAEFIGLPATGRPGFKGLPLGERLAQPVTGRPGLTGVPLSERLAQPVTGRPGFTGVPLSERLAQPVTGRPGFTGVPLSGRLAQPVTERTMHLSISQSLYLYCHVSSKISMRVEWGMVLIAVMIIHTLTVTLIIIVNT